MLKKLIHQKYYLLGALSILIASFFSSGYYHFDEHFQILEYAGLKLGLTPASDLSWEFNHLIIKSSLLPTFVVIFYRIFEFFGNYNPFFLSFVLRLLSGILTFFTMTLIYNLYHEKINDNILKKWFLILSFSLWFIIYLGVRFSSENWSGLFFAIGFSFYFLKQKRHYFSFVIIGLLLGLSFLFRYQTAFLTTGFILWLLIIKREKFINIIILAFAFILIVSIGVLIDKWFYDKWTFIPWNYFVAFINGNPARFGTSPWWWYFKTSILKGIPPISLLFVTALIIISIFKPTSPIVWSVVPFLFIHIIIGHKELRFLFPIYPFVPIIIIQGIEVLQDKYKWHLSSNRYMQKFMKFIFIINGIILLIVMLKPADDQIPLYKTLYDNYKEATTLYYLEGNPYHRICNINFYKRKNLTIKHIESIKLVKKDHTKMHKLIVLENVNKLKNHKFGKLIYTSYPDWIYNFNFNNWIERSHIWYVYEIQ